MDAALAQRLHSAGASQLAAAVCKARITTLADALLYTAKQLSDALAAVGAVGEPLHVFMKVVAKKSSDSLPAVTSAAGTTESPYPSVDVQQLFAGLQDQPASTPAPAGHAALAGLPLCSALLSLEADTSVIPALLQQMLSLVGLDERSHSQTAEMDAELLEHALSANAFTTRQLVPAEKGARGARMHLLSMLSRAPTAGRGDPKPLHRSLAPDAAENQQPPGDDTNVLLHELIHARGRLSARYRQWMHATYPPHDPRVIAWQSERRRRGRDQRPERQSLRWSSSGPLSTCSVTT